MFRARALPIAVVACIVAGVEPLGCSASDKAAAQQDTDGDGLSDAEELNLYGTSPVLSDTDGDGFSDFQEIVTFAFDPTNDPYRFNPRVADVPQMTVRFAGPPVVTVQTTDEDGVIMTIEHAHAVGVTMQQRMAETDTNTRSDTLTTSQ